MGARKAKHGLPLTIFFSVLSLLYVYPIVLVIINSFKKDVYISRMPFKLPLDNLFVGIENYIRGIEKSGLLRSDIVSSETKQIMETFRTLLKETHAKKSN